MRKKTIGYKNVSSLPPSTKKKLLYLMGIDWNWIYQRPQILEQYLEKHYDVTVVFPRSILKWKQKSKCVYPSKYAVLWTLPFQEKNKLIGCLSNLYSKIVFRDINKYDIAIIGYPLYFRYLIKKYKGKVIYDCMDNHKALYPYIKGVDKLCYFENSLIADSDAIIVTADKLRQKMKSLNYGDKTFLIRNGTNLNVMSSPRKAILEKRYKIGYFGTIAEWFDYDVLQQSVNEYQDIEYHLIGPVRKSIRLNHDRLIMEGIVEHNKLLEKTKDYACFVMPFIVNDIVEWVDPVKLYEYIAMGKCIIAVQYEEIERFHDFIYTYSGTKEYLQLLGDLKREGFPPKYSAEQQIAFLNNNSWKKRFELLDSVLESDKDTLS